MSNRYVFDPRPEIADWIDDHIDSWTAFCYDNIYREQKRVHYERFDKLTNKFGMVLIGCILLSLTYIIPIHTTWLIFFGAGIIFLSLGFFGIYWEVKNGRS